MKTVKDIRTYLEQAELTQAQLADRLGISQPFLSQIIAGDRRPSLELAAKIEDETGVPMRSLLPVAS